MGELVKVQEQKKKQSLGCARIRGPAARKKCMEGEEEKKTELTNVPEQKRKNEQKRKAELVKVQEQRRKQYSCARIRGPAARKRCMEGEEKKKIELTNVPEQKRKNEQKRKAELVKVQEQKKKQYSCARIRG